ncbi:MAG: LytTR family DNA-binding domain-containing protein [Bacteroides sp.]|nr:LytTR family DNA-binding domain-containing protein [Bacteroides sp.]
MILNCAIIDDEPLALDLLKSYVAKTPFLKLTGRYPNAVQAMREISSQEVDILFLDIQMPEVNGIEFSKMIDPKTRVIFTTAFNQYAVDSYRVNALDYLLKPISYSDFMKAAGKALQWFEIVRRPQERALTTEPREEIEAIYVKSDYKLIQIELRKIRYIEGLKDYIKIYLENEPKPILSLMSMKAMEDLLPSHRFMRVHRSFIVQKEKIKVIDRGRIVFEKTYIPISDSYKQAFSDFLESKKL